MMKAPASESSFPALMPIPVPTGYAVCFNEFYDVEPTTVKPGETLLANSEFFSEDLLQIAKMVVVQGEWQIPRNSRKVFDLGWYPAGHVNGEYRLVEAVVNGDADWHPRTIVTSRDRREIISLLFGLMR